MKVEKDSCDHHSTKRVIYSEPSLWVMTQDEHTISLGSARQLPFYLRSSRSSEIITGEIHLFRLTIFVPFRLYATHTDLATGSSSP